MTTTATDVHDGAEHHGHFTPEQKDRKERMAVWLLIGGDAVFLALELFTWFYLRALNVSDGWRYSLATSSNQYPHCPGDSCSPINFTGEIPKIGSSWTLIVTVLALAAGAAVWWAEAIARKRVGRSMLVGALLLTTVLALAAVVAQFVQFQHLPVVEVINNATGSPIKMHLGTIMGTYASTALFYMGANIAHFLIVLLVALGLTLRASRGKYDASFYEIRLGRLFFVWVGLSTLVLSLVSILFA